MFLRFRLDKEWCFYVKCLRKLYIEREMGTISNQEPKGIALRCLIIQ